MAQPRIAFSSLGVIWRHQLSPICRLLAADLRRASPLIRTTFSVEGESSKDFSTSSKYRSAVLRPDFSVSRATNACSRAAMMAKAGEASGISKRSSSIVSDILVTHPKVPDRNLATENGMFTSKFRVKAATSARKCGNESQARA